MMFVGSLLPIEKPIFGAKSTPVGPSEGVKTLHVTTADTVSPNYDCVTLECQLGDVVDWARPIADIIKSQGRLLGRQYDFDIQPRLQSRPPCILAVVTKRLGELVITYDYLRDLATYQRIILDIDPLDLDMGEAVTDHLQGNRPIHHHLYSPSLIFLRQHE